MMEGPCLVTYVMKLLSPVDCCDVLLVILVKSCDLDNAVYIFIKYLIKCTDIKILHIRHIRRFSYRRILKMSDIFPH
jgi:hypothetical protein